jgi:hypothetical protein
MRLKHNNCESGNELQKVPHIHTVSIMSWRKEKVYLIKVSYNTIDSGVFQSSFMIRVLVRKEEMQ